MKLLFAPAMNNRDARAQQTILNNAKTLFQSGYTLQALPNAWEGLVYVTGKDGSTYAVDAHARCACRGFEWHKDCKHRIGVALRIGLLTEADLVVVRADIRRAV